MRIPTTDMIAPTTSSFRSGVSESHQERLITGLGGAAGCVFFFGEDLLSPLPREGVTALLLGFPAGFELDLDAGDGVLRGMSESIAQMVCFSFTLILISLYGFRANRE
jgi:hypothetical protein